MRTGTTRMVLLAVLGVLCTSCEKQQLGSGASGDMENMTTRGPVCGTSMGVRNQLRECYVNILIAETEQAIVASGLLLDPKSSDGDREGARKMLRDSLSGLQSVGAKLRDIDCGSGKVHEQ